jgi:hypothetical protein
MRLPTDPPILAESRKMRDDMSFEVVDPAHQLKGRAEIQAFLKRCSLDYDAGIEAFFACRRSDELVACGGLEKNAPPSTRHCAVWHLASRS